MPTGYRKKSYAQRHDVPMEDISKQQVAGRAMTATPSRNVDVGRRLDSTIECSVAPVLSDEVDGNDHGHFDQAAIGSDGSVSKHTSLDMASDHGTSAADASIGAVDYGGTPTEPLQAPASPKAASSRLILPLLGWPRLTPAPPSTATTSAAQTEACSKATNHEGDKPPYFLVQMEGDVAGDYQTRVPCRVCREYNGIGYRVIQSVDDEESLDVPNQMEDFDYPV